MRIECSRGATRLRKLRPKILGLTRFLERLNFMQVSNLFKIKSTVPLYTRLSQCTVFHPLSNLLKNTKICGRQVSSILQLSMQSLLYKIILNIRSCQVSVTTSKKGHSRQLSTVSRWSATLRSKTNCLTPASLTNKFSTKEISKEKQTSRDPPFLEAIKIT